MLTDDSVSLLLGRLNLILHSLDLALHLLELGLGRIQLALQHLDLPLELLNERLQVHLLLLLLLQHLFMAPLYLLNIFDVVLLFLGELTVKVAVELSNQLLMFLLELLDLLRVLGLQSFKLSRRGCSHVGPQLGDFFLVSGVEGFDLLGVLEVYLLDRVLVVPLQLLDALLELLDNLALLIHEFLFVLSMLCLQLLDFSLKLRDALFELHLEEFFVAAGVFAQLVEHPLVLFLLLLKLALHLFGQADLHVLELALGLDLELLELRLKIAQLFAQRLGRFVTTLHRIVQLVFQAGNLGLQLFNCAIELNDIALFLPELFMQVRNLALVVTNLPFTLSNDGLKLSNLIQQLFFSLLSSSAHILLFLFDQAEKLVNAGLHLRAKTFALLIFLHGQ